MWPKSIPIDPIWLHYTKDKVIKHTLPEKWWSPQRGDYKALWSKLFTGMTTPKILSCEELLQYD